MKTKISRGTFFRRCPECGEISGFCLTKEVVVGDEKYYCHKCGKESKLSNWLASTERNYLRHNGDSPVAKKIRR